MKHLIFLLCLLPFCLQAQATATPIGVNFQGRLTDSNGANLPDGTGYEITFRIWSAASDGSLVWGATYSNIAVKSGSFNIVLGADGGAPVPGIVETTDLSAAFNAPGRYLGLTVKKGAMGTPVTTPTEIQPRQQLLTVPFAFASAKAALVNTDGVLTAAIKDGEVKTADIATDAVTNAKIATGAVNADSISANTITSFHLANASINPDRLNPIYGMFYHEVASNTDAAAVAGWQRRTLNVGANATSGDITRSGSTITLKTGTYFVEATVAMDPYLGSQLIFRDVTDNPTGTPTAAEADIVGLTAYTSTNDHAFTFASSLAGYVTVTAATAKYELWHWITPVSTASGQGQSAAISSGGQSNSLPNRYAQLHIVRIR